MRFARPASNTTTIHAALSGPTPTANSDITGVTHDHVLTVAAPGVLGNDTNPAGGSMTAALAANVSHGTLALNANGSFVYTPATHFVGGDSFNYTASNANGASAPATVSLYVSDSAPTIASVPGYGVTHDHTLTAAAPGLRAYVSDADGDPTTLAITTQPTHGSLSLNADGSFNYVPAARFYGGDSFQFTASDGILTSNLALVNVYVSDAAPVIANNSGYSTKHDTTLNVAAPGLRGNNNITDADNDPTTLAVTTQPTHGSVTLNADGSFRYIPAARFVGTDTFQYTASDGLRTSTPATVTIGVTNRAPRFTNGGGIGFGMTHDQTLNVPAPGVLGGVVDDDGDPFTPAIAAQPAHGGVTLNPDGSFRYVPFAGFIGSDFFTVTAGDGLATSPAMPVTIAVNDAAPTISGPSGYSIIHDHTLSLAAPGLRAGVTDADGDPFTLAISTQAAHGAVTLNPDGSFNYVPTANWYGSDSFAYSASDGLRTSSPWTVRIDVTDRAPIAYGNKAISELNAPVSIDILGGGQDQYGNPAADSDPDGDPIHIVGVAGAQHGTIRIISGPDAMSPYNNPNPGQRGSLIYTPTPGYNGYDTFTYTIADNCGVTATATVKVTDRAGYHLERNGNANDPAQGQINSQGGLLMEGGGYNADANQWLVQHVNGGNIVVITLGMPLERNYAQMFRDAAGPNIPQPNAITTLAFNWGRVPQDPGAAQDAANAANAAARDAADSPEIKSVLQNAQAVFFTGGDQYGYIWTFHGTALQSTIEGNYAGGKFVIGGTSAGLAIQGDVDFSARLLADPIELLSSEALTNPYGPKVTLDTSFLQVAPLKDVITETHFAIDDRDPQGRMGRLVAFLGRSALDDRVGFLRGVGIYSLTAVLYEASTGMAKVVGDGNAYFLTQPSDNGPSLDAQNRLIYPGIKVRRVDRTTAAFRLSDALNPAVAFGTQYIVSAASGDVTSNPAAGNPY